MGNFGTEGLSELHKVIQEVSGKAGNWTLGFQSPRLALTTRTVLTHHGIPILTGASGHAVINKEGQNSRTGFNFVSHWLLCISTLSSVWKHSLFQHCFLLNYFANGSLSSVPNRKRFQSHWTQINGMEKFRDAWKKMCNNVKTKNKKNQPPPTKLKILK